MFYKFVGGETDALLQIFGRAVGEGSFEFGCAGAFNDPFEFKFRSVPPPSREVFDAWHRQQRPERSADELENAWQSFEGEAASWNTELQPRMDALSQMFVLCLAQRWDCHLMWAYYTHAHRGFAIRYKPELSAALRALPEYDGDFQVEYGDGPPELRWFSDHFFRDVGRILASKPAEWAYEQEYRFVCQGAPNRDALYVKVDPDLIDGVILGVRAPEALIQKACQLRRERPDLKVEQVVASGPSYALSARTVEANRRALIDFL